MKHIVLASTTYFALAAHAACANALTIGDCRPPLMWLPVVLALSWFADVRGIVWAVVIGLLADGLSDSHFGIEMLAATLTAALTLSLRPDEDVSARGPWWVWRFSVIATGLILSRGLSVVLSDGAAITANSLATTACEAAYGLVLCGVLGVRWLDTALHRSRRIANTRQEMWS